MSGSPRTDTVARLTDNVVDAILSRLGNDGVSLGDDFASRLNQMFGGPLEVTPSTPASLVLAIAATSYTLADGLRLAILDDGVLPALTAGSMNFAAGTISTGANPSFALPTLTTGQFVKALVQYKVDENKVNVTFGSAAGSLAAAGVPALLDGYSAAYIVELTVTGGTPGAFAAVAKTNLVKIMNGIRSTKSLVREKQDVTTTSQSVFNLATITIPKNRNRLLVLQGGAVLDPADDYTIGSDTQVTLATPALNGARLTFIVI